MTDHQEAERGYCADCNSWGGEHKAKCERRPERFSKPMSSCTPAAVAVGAEGLPELPKAVRMSSDQAYLGYTVYQMQQYARDAIAADRMAVQESKKENYHGRD
jgi:hypothetical protein